MPSRAVLRRIRYNDSSVRPRAPEEDSWLPAPIPGSVLQNRARRRPGTHRQAGALAGAATFGLGAIAGAALGAAAGAALGRDAQGGQFNADEDAYYRALYEGAPASGRSYESVRAAYVFGHVAATEPGLAGQTFEGAEPALQEAWTDELRAKAGDWAGVRGYVHDAFGHARAEGAGERRDRTVIGSAGSAVDPVELDRARHGLPSVSGVPAGEEYGTGVTPGTYE